MTVDIGTLAGSRRVISRGQATGFRQRAPDKGGSTIHVGSRTGQGGNSRVTVGTTQVGTESDGR